MTNIEIKFPSRLNDIPSRCRTPKRQPVDFTMRLPSYPKSSGICVLSTLMHLCLCDKPTKFGNPFAAITCRSRTVYALISGLLIDNNLRKQEGTDVPLHRTPRRSIQPLTLDRKKERLSSSPALPCPVVVWPCCVVHSLSFCINIIPSHRIKPDQIRSDRIVGITLGC
jgi:hypothetical protein